VLKSRTGRRTRPRRFSAAFIALAISLLASAYSVALAGAQESVGGGGSASYDSGSNTFTGSGSTSPGGSCSTTGSTTNTGGTSGGSCTTDSASCSTNGSMTQFWTESSSSASGSCTTEECSVAAGETNGGSTGSGSCKSDLGECSGSGGGSTGGTSSVGGGCTTAGGDSCSATGTGSSSSGGQNASAGAQCTPSAEPAVSIADAQATEGNSGWHALTFTLTLSKEPAVPVVVRAATADGTATAASNDYESASSQVVFLPGQTKAYFSVIVNGDLLAEENETFAVVLSEPQPSGVTIADGTAAGTIVNDDRRSGTSGGGGGGSTNPGGSGSGGSVSAGGSAGTSGGGAQGSASVERTPRANTAPRCVVPRLRGKTVSQARAALRAANCRPGARIYRRSAMVGMGRVVNSTPSAGQSRRNGARVAMIVSSGKPLAKRARKKQVKVEVGTR
jgi:hypothetical protein